MEEEFEEDFTEEVHGDIVPPLWAQPLIEVVYQNECLDNNFRMIDSFKNEFKRLKEIQVIERPW